MTTAEEFLALAQKWQWHYNVERPHFEAGMEGRTPMERLRELGLDLPNEFAAFPVVLLDEVAVIWASKGGHDVLAYYILQLALTQLRRNPESRAYYKRKRGEGKPHWVALTALARKLCKRVYKLMREEAAVMGTY